MQLFIEIWIDVPRVFSMFGWNKGQNCLINQAKPIVEPHDMITGLVLKIHQIILLNHARCLKDFAFFMNEEITYRYINI